MSCHISTNVRCLLWRKGVPRSDWGPEIARRTGLSRSRVHSFLEGDVDDTQLDDRELEMLAEVVGLGDEPDLIRHAGYALGNCDILAENLRSLVDGLGRGGKKQLAAKLNVDPTTLSRWLNGSFIPQTSTLRELISYFGLPANSDLQVDPVFLSAHPVSAGERRNWLHKRIDSLPQHELGLLYPALQRLLEEK